MSEREKKAMAALIAEIHGKIPWLYDPTLSLDYDINITLTVYEARVFVNMAAHAGITPAESWHRYTINGDPIE